MANIGDNCNKCNSKLTTKTAIKQRVRIDGTIAYRTECKSCMRAYNQSKRPHIKKPVITNCRECNCLLTESNTVYKPYKVKDGTIKQSRTTKCKDCTSKINNNVYGKQRLQKSRLCPKCNIEKKLYSFARDSSEMCKACEKGLDPVVPYNKRKTTKTYHLKSGTVSFETKVKKVIPIVEVKEDTEIIETKKEIESRNEQRIKEEQDYLVNIEKVADSFCYGRKKNDRSIVYQLSDKDRKMQEDFLNNKKVKNEKDNITFVC